MSVGWVAAGATLASGYMASQSASDAADAQTAAANQSNETQRYMYDTTRADNAPFLANGTAANNRLAYLLGVRQTPTATKSDVVSQIRAAFPHWGGNQAYSDEDLLANFKQYAPVLLQNGKDLAGESLLSGQPADLKRILANIQASQETPAPENPANDPAFGSLLRRFSLQDLNNDPVYQTGLKFGLDEGNKGIERQAAASGQMLSGATLKALAKYANDYGSTKAGEAYNRFNNDQTNTYNRLAGVAGTGQQANSLVANAGMNTANNISQNQIGVGNARAASSIGSANGWSGALSNGINTYQQNQLLNKLTPQSGQWWNSAEGINANGGGF